MNYKFYLLSTSLFTLPLNSTHLISNRKFAKGFQQNGYEVIEITSDEDIDKIENEYGNVILLSNHTDFINRIDDLRNFGEKYDKIFYILWCMHWLKNIPFQHYIYTFQYNAIKSNNQIYANEYDFYNYLSLQNKFLPYCFASYLDPNIDIKMLNNVEKNYDVIYIGYNYDNQLLIRLREKYNTFIHVYDGSSRPIVGDEFELLYRQSKICLGLQSDINIDTGTITERIWEAFSFGTLVLTNGQTVDELTNNTAIYYKNHDDCIEKIDYYLNLDNKDEFDYKIQKGYDIFTTYGSYKHSVKPFVNHINTLFNSI